MGYNIYHSNSLSEFIKIKSKLFHETDLFGDQVITVVQNSNIASWLKLELAKDDGISMDLKFEFPEQAVKKLLYGFKSGRDLFKLEDGTEKSLLFMDSLKIVLFKTLEEDLSDGSLYPELYKYVDNSTQRLFQLADSLAGLFYHYGMNCPGMVASWDKGFLFADSDGVIRREKDQLWQMTLWNRVFNSETPYLHISKVLNRVLESGESFEPDQCEFGPCRIILFGSSFLGESAIKFFNYLSRDIDVHHFILTPSEIYSTDEPVEPAPILNKFSGLINGFTNISREPGFNKIREGFWKKDQPQNLLQELQHSIRSNSSPSLTGADSSLKVCRVTGAWREIEILKDKILGLLDSDENLKLTDIGVVAPDIGEYSTYIEGIFPVGDSKFLPYNIMGLKGGEESPYTRGILALLELPGTDFNRKDILNLISNPCFMERFGISNSAWELYLDTIDNLNMKWGLDEDHRAELGYERDDFNTWEIGFEKILKGMALNSEEGMGYVYSTGDSQSTEALGDLIHILRSLYSDLTGLNRLKLKLEEWVLLIETIMETYLKPVKNDLADERERLSIKHQYRNILNLAEDLKFLENFETRVVPFTLFKSLLKEFIVKAGGVKGRYLTQGITFSSLKPLRAVPFKHIFVLGLNEDKFPGRERVPGYDLRGIYDQKIDLSKRQNDKFAFLELILSAEQSLTLFYNNRNPVSGEELQPSIVISELLEELKGVKDEDIIETHPLHNFDTKYFSPGSGLNSYNEGAFNSAVAYQNLKDQPIDLILDAQEDSDEPLEIRVDELISFLKNPVKSFVTKGEGIYITDEDLIEEDLYENRDLEFLAKWKFADLVIEKGLTESVSIETLCRDFFNTAEVKGVFKEGKLTSNVREDVETLISEVDNFLSDNDLKHEEIKREVRELEKEFKPFLFDFNGKKVKLTGELEMWKKSSGDCFTTRVSLSKKSNKMKVKDKIQPYIYSLILSGHPDMEEKQLEAYSIGPAHIEPVPFSGGDDGADKLKSVVELYLKNRVNPIPLYPEIFKKPEAEDLEVNWKKEAGEYGSEPIKSCPYIHYIYGDDPPEFDQEIIDQFYNVIYKELL